MLFPNPLRDSAPPKNLLVTVLHLFDAKPAQLSGKLAVLRRITLFSQFLDAALPESTPVVRTSTCTPKDEVIYFTYIV